MSGDTMPYMSTDAMRLELWDYVGPKCQALVERVLASQGENAEPELIQLQHELAQLNGPSGKPSEEEEQLSEEEEQRERACIHTNTFSPFNP